MVGLFRNRSTKNIVNDQIWLTTEEKFRACQKMLLANPDIVFVAWFDKTARMLKNTLLLNANTNTVLEGEQLSEEHKKNKILFFVEHYPLIEKEQNLFTRLALNNVPVLSALDEPFFDIFGGARIRELMQKMGTKEDEVISHGMISKSILRAQEQIAKKVLTEKTATAAQQWFKMNGLI